MTDSNKSRNELHDRFYAFRIIHSGKSGRRLTYWLLGILAVGLGALFLPWRQNIQATGQVTAFSPSDRPQRVNATIDGRIEQWYVREGQFVAAGDTIIRISEVKEKFFDPELLERLDEQVAAKEAALEATTEKISALRNQISALENSGRLSLDKAHIKRQQADLKARSDSAAAIAASLDYQVAKDRLLRMEELYAQGLKSLTDVESRRLKLQEASAKLTEAENKFLSSMNERFSARINLNSVQAEYAEKVAKANSDLNATIAYRSEAVATLSKLKNERKSIEIRSGFYVIRAPQDGFVVQALKAGIGEMVHAGEAVVTVMPDHPRRAVELYVSAMDVPLLRPGRKVRLQFEGWPALQFSGWPSASVGTFGGEIAVVDYVGTNSGKFRVLVVPDSTEEAWPENLRIGAGVHGWAMLDEVPVWYELWRQLNSFPPRFPEGEDADKNMNASKGGKKK